MTRLRPLPGQRLRRRPLLRLPRQLAAIAISIVLLLGLLVAPSAGGRAQDRSKTSPRAHAAATYLTGVGDEQHKMFANLFWQQLHTKIVRYIVPYDAAVRSYSLDRAKLWIHAAEARHQQILIAFYHSEYTPTKLPSVASFQRDVQKFVKLFPRVHQYQSWDEANRGQIPRVLASPSAATAARYYQALIRVCKGCTAIGLDVLDQANIGPTLRYISEFKREIGKLRTIMPRIWGLHNYSDVNRLESWRTREISRALGGEVWLTETGGIVKFGGAFPNTRGSGLTRAAKVLKYMFAVASSQRQIKRLYIYDWTGGTAATRFDAGLASTHGQPRAGYLIVCRQLHAAKCSNVRLARN